MRRLGSLTLGPFRGIMAPSFLTDIPEFPGDFRADPEQTYSIVRYNAGFLLILAEAFQGKKKLQRRSRFADVGMELENHLFNRHETFQPSSAEVMQHQIGAGAPPSPSKPPLS